MIKLGIVLPTNNPEDMFKFFIPTVADLCMADDIEIRILAMFQPPWTGELISKAIEDIFQYAEGMFVHYLFVTYNSPPNMCSLRNWAAELWPEADYYMFVDDNFKFSTGTRLYPRSSGERYWEVIQYMEKFTECGVVMCEGSLGGSIQKWSIKPYSGGLIATARGLFFRAHPYRTPNLFPADSLNVVGGYEESILAFDYVQRGYYIAKQFNNPTQHKNRLKRPIPLEEGEAYIRARWHDPDWTHNSRRLPAQLQGNLTLYHEIDFA